MDLRADGDTPEVPRVVHVVTRFARGGSERRLLDALVVPGEHHVIAGTDSAPDRLEALAERCEVTVNRHLVRQVHPFNDARAMSELMGTFRRLRPDVVHTHQSKAGLLGRVAAASTGVPVTYHSASMASFGPGFSPMGSRAYRMAERISARYVDRYLVVGRDLCSRLSEAGIPPSRMTVVRSSIDVEAFPTGGWFERAAAREALGVAADASVVAFVGSLEPRKGIDRLPGIVARASTADRPVTMLIAGDGPLRAEIEALDLPEVELRVLGHVDDVARVLHAADVLALPSAAEGLPQVLVQAAMCATPFVAYDVDGVRELLDLGARGTAVAFGDDQALGAALIDALEPVEVDLPVDRSTWLEWDRDVIGQRYSDIYQGDLAQRGPRPVAPRTRQVA